MDSCAVSLLSLHSVSIGDILLPVSLGYVANLLPFAVPLHNLNYLILLDMHGSNTVLLSQLFGKRGKT